MLDTKRKGLFGKVVYHLTGRIDSQTAEPLYVQIVEAEGSGLKSLTLNLAGVDFVSSAGLRTVIKLTRFCNGQGAVFAVSSMQPGVAKIFDIAKALPETAVFVDDAEADAYFEAMAKRANRGTDDDD
jgi:anti-anti-sigma factor